MMLRIVGAAVVSITCALIPAPSAAQSLADVARQEEARRKTAKKALKSFSNADLAPSEIADVQPPTAVAAKPAGCIESASQGKCVPPEEVSAANATGTAVAVDPQVKTSEATVRQQADLIRQRLLKVQQEFEGVNATANDPSRSPGERAAAARMASQRETMLVSVEKQWRALEKLVADEELPREWLGVTPLLSTRTPQ
jgi:hypothetical protein